MTGSESLVSIYSPARDLASNDRLEQLSALVATMMDSPTPCVCVCLSVWMCPAESERESIDSQTKTIRVKPSVASVATGKTAPRASLHLSRLARLRCALGERRKPSKRFININLAPLVGFFPAKNVNTLFHINSTVVEPPPQVV